METFFQQEVERLKFTTERAAVRARDRKAVEEARAKAEEVSAVYHASAMHGSFRVVQID